MLIRHRMMAGGIWLLAVLATWSAPLWAAAANDTPQPLAVTTLPAYYAYTKTVTLSNTGSAPALNVNAKIVLLAPASPYAHVSLVGYSREPASTYRDKNGNLIGLFSWASIKAEQSVTVTLHYQATSSDISYHLPTLYANYNQRSAVYHDYTNPHLEAAKVDTGAPAIRELDQKLVGNLSNPYQRAQVLFNWVSSHIRYNYSLKSSGSALATLRDRLGICSDIADLYVSMLRTDGIPARLIGGYVTNNGAGKGGFHQWAEFYLPKSGWVVADPTWGQYGYFASLQDDWHIPLYDGIRPDISVHWQYAKTDSSQSPYLTINYHYRFATEQSPPVMRHVKLPLVSVTPPVAQHHAVLAVAQTVHSGWQKIVAFFHQYMLRLKIILASL